MSWLAVALGGAAGACARYGLSLTLSAPWGTLVANGLGCLLMGVIYGVLADRPEVLSAVRPWVMTGLLGALTTYSTFALETHLFVQDGRLATAAGYAVGTLLLSLLACGAGLLLARTI